MAENTSRSMNRDLDEGLTDGKYKKRATRERGGQIDPATLMNRRDLNDIWYGVHAEAPIKVRPDGKVARG